MRIPIMPSMAALLQRSDCKSLRYIRRITFTETWRISNLAVHPSQFSRGEANRCG